MRIFLGKSGFLSSAASEVTQPERAVLMIRLLYSLLPGICALLIVILSLKLTQLEKLVPMIEEPVADNKLPYEVKSRE